jgi:hypothetical protein
MSFISFMYQKRVFIGKNIILKNNLKSLILRRSDAGKQKIEHEQGAWIDLFNENWETSKMGYYGKDLSDAVVASISLADLYGTENADYIWNEEKELEKKDQIGIELFKKDLLQKYNLIVK